jgi:hypothetical protein
VATYVNGYRIGRDWRKLGAKVYRVPGAPGISLILRADIAPLLLYAAREWNRRVEPLHRGWCWSFNYRDVRGMTQPSFHAACAAIDCNAPLHPLGTNPAHSFSKRQIREIHKILDELHGTVRWGGSYTHRKDPMHLEVIARPEHAAAVAKQFTRAAAVRPTPKPTPRPAPRPGPLPAPHPVPAPIPGTEDDMRNLVIFGIDVHGKVVSEAAYLHNPFTGETRRLVDHADWERAKAAGAREWPIPMDKLRALGGS